MKKLVTPECIVKFPEYGDETISFNLCFDPETCGEFISELNAMNEGNENAVFRNDKSKNEEGVLEENGLLSMKVKTKTEYGVKAFNPDGTLIQDQVGWGSKVKASITVKPYEYLGKKGLSKYLNGFQVLELKGAGNTAESMGFEPVSDEEFAF